MIKLKLNKEKSNAKVQQHYTDVIKALENDIKEINQHCVDDPQLTSKFWSLFIKQLFQGCIYMPGNCEVVLVDRATMQIYENGFREALNKQLRQCEEFIDKLLKMCGEKYEELIKPLKRLREALDYREEKEIDLAHLLRELFPELKRCLKDLLAQQKNTNQNDPENKELAEIIKLLQALLQQLKMINPVKNIMGLFLRAYYAGAPHLTDPLNNPNKDQIYLCLENIEREADRTVLGDLLVFKYLTLAVLIHEYTHCVHHHYMHQHNRKALQDTVQVQKSAVLETIAESVQKQYIKLKLEQTQQVHQQQAQAWQRLLKWIKSHSAAGVFPGWGYAGMLLLEKESDYNSAREDTLLTGVIGISQYDWQRAYALLDKLDNKYGF